jgi:hypothetical protein
VCRGLVAARDELALLGGAGELRAQGLDGGGRGAGGELGLRADDQRAVLLEDVLRSFGEHRDDGRLVEPTEVDEERPFRRDLELERLAERALAAPLVGEVVGVVAGGEGRIDRRVVDRRIDAVLDAEHGLRVAGATSASAQHTVETLSAFGREQHGGVGRRRSGDRVGGEDAGLGEGHAAVELERLGREVRGVEAERAERLSAEDHLPGEVVQGQHRAQPSELLGGPSEVGGRRRGPVVGVHHVVGLARDRALTGMLHGRAAECGEA